MARPPRDECPGYHHVVTRGNNKRAVYLDDRDRTIFCLIVDRTARRFGWRILSYCLMENHYHLLVSVGEKGLAAGMCELNTAYARTFNANHDRINHLFGRRYWNRHIRTDVAFLTLVRYIVQNPRRAGGTKPLEAYRWTSYAASLGLAFPDIQLARDELLAAFGPTPERAVDTFRMFCSAAVLGGQVRCQAP